MARNTGEETEAARAGDPPQSRRPWPTTTVPLRATPSPPGIASRMSLGARFLLDPAGAAERYLSMVDDPAAAVDEPAAVDVEEAERGEVDGDDAGTPAVGDPKSPVDDLAPAPSTLSRTSWWVVALTFVFAIASIAVVFADESDETLWWKHDEWIGSAFTASVWFVFLAILHIADTRTSGKGYGIFRPVIGDDNRWSTSLTQLAMWTVAVGVALAWLIGLVIFADLDLDTVFDDDVWDQYLILLGGPFAAAVLAKGVVQYKTENGIVQKVEPAPDAQPSPTQIYKADGGGGDLVDAQYLLFNLIALGYFVVEFASSGSLPEIPGPLLALTGGAAALYAGNKAVASNAPSITSVTPRTVRPGDTVTVFGVNFVPAGDDNPLRAVTATITGCPEALATVSEPEATRARFQIPASAQAGNQTIRITSTTGVQTAPQDLEVRTDAPALFGVDPERPFRPGADVVLTGERLGRDGERWSVEVCGVLSEARVADRGTALEFRAPGGHLFTTNEATLTLVGPAGEQATVAVEVVRPRVVTVRRGVANPAELVAVVADAGDDPTFLVNDRVARVTPSGSSYRVTVPAGVDPAGEVRLRVADGLHLRSEETVIGAEA